MSLFDTAGSSTSNTCTGVLRKGIVFHGGCEKKKQSLGITQSPGPGDYTYLHSKNYYDMNRRDNSFNSRNNSKVKRKDRIFISDPFISKSKKTDRSYILNPERRCVNVNMYC